MMNTNAMLRVSNVIFLLVNIFGFALTVSYLSMNSIMAQLIAGVFATGIIAHGIAALIIAR